MTQKNAARGPEGAIRDELWSLWNDALDRREDPLDDPAILAILLDHPEWLDEMAAARAALREIERVAPSASGRVVAPVRAYAALPVALLAAAAVLVLVLRLPIESRSPGSEASPGEILSYRVTVVIEDEVARIRTIDDGSVHERVVEWRATIDPPAGQDSVQSLVLRRETRAAASLATR